MGENRSFQSKQQTQEEHVNSTQKVPGQTFWGGQTQMTNDTNLATTSPCN